jgi:hypothetical protein
VRTADPQTRGSRRLRTGYRRGKCWDLPHTRCVRGDSMHEQTTAEIVGSYASVMGILLESPYSCVHGESRTSEIRIKSELSKNVSIVGI